MTTAHIADTLQQAANLSKEAELLKTLAADAVEDGLQAARQTIEQAKQRAVGARDELAHRVQREPMKAMAVIFASGAVIGLGLGLLCRRQTRKAIS